MIYKVGNSQQKKDFYFTTREEAYQYAKSIGEQFYSEIQLHNDWMAVSLIVNILNGNKNWIQNETQFHINNIRMPITIYPPTSVTGKPDFSQ